MNFLDAIILGIIEGLTEFLPVSSTGHMILAADFLRLQNQEFLKTFEISIQIGAILAIVCLYARRLIGDTALYKRLIVAFLPTALVGFLFYKIIKTYLFNPIVVAAALIIGGVILVAIDKTVSDRGEARSAAKDLTYRSAFFIGLFQSVSVIPGVSRAAATIVGGVFNGLGKKQATEFSFLLAVPTMFAAAGYDLFKVSTGLTVREYLLIGCGGIVSFVSAWIAVKLFLRFLDRHGLAPFGYYRIILGLIFLALAVLK